MDKIVTRLQQEAEIRIGLGCSTKAHSILLLQYLPRVLPQVRYKNHSAVKMPL